MTDAKKKYGFFLSLAGALLLLCWISPQAYAQVGGVCRIDCAATTINDCALPAGIHRTTAGTCAASGSCSYTCNDGVWALNSNTCSAAATCSDGIQNQGETGVDCGGPCAACPTCSDGIQNGTETGVDCGGSCPACPGETCNNGFMDLDEDGIDCGGPCISCSANCISPSCNLNSICDAGESGCCCSDCPPPPKHINCLHIICDTSVC
jgi:hypothetical protein